MKQLKTQNNSLHAHPQSGFSLMVVLGFVGLMASIITLTVMGNRGAVQSDQAHAAGWHLAKIARAARIYVRDNSLETSQPYHKSALSSGVSIPFATLVNAGLLPNNFSDTNVLGQKVEIYAGLSPITEGGVMRLGTPADDDAVATAYIYLTPVTLTENRPELLQELVSGAKQSGLYVDAPVFDQAGNIISSDCDGDGAADVALWDTSCLDAPDFTTITAKNFVKGGLLSPSWRTNDYDNRAIMRYPQPENPGWATMMTTLEMAPPIVNGSNECTNFVSLTVPDNAGGAMNQGTALCNVRNDTASADRRVDIVAANSLEALTIIAADQGGSEARFNAATGITTYGAADPRTKAGDNTREVIGVNGPIIANSNVWANATMATPSGRRNVEVGDFGIDHNIIVSNKSSVHGNKPGTPGIDVSNKAIVKEFRSTGKLDVGNTLDVKGVAGASNFDVTNKVTVNNNCGGGECGLVTDDLQVNNRTTVNDTALFLSGFGADQMKVTGGGNYATNAILVDSKGKMDVGGDLSAARSLTTDGTTTTRANLYIQNCTHPTGNGCPDVKEDGPWTDDVDVD